MDDDAALAMAIAQSLEDTAGSSQPGLPSREQNLDIEDQENIDRAIALSLQEQNDSPGEVRPAENPQNAGNDAKGGYLSSFVNSLFRGSFFHDSKHSANPSTSVGPAPAPSSSVRSSTRNHGQQLNPFTASLTRAMTSPSDSLCPTCANPVSPLFQHVKFADHLYHDGCFRCFGCQERLITTGVSGNQAQSFSIKDGLPYHPKCAQRLFAPPCSICHCSLQGRFFVHPFFEDFRYCLSHEGTRPSCFACRRQEPLVSNNASPSEFIVLPDGRHLCGECSETVVMESAEMKILYNEVLHYFISELNLNVPAEMFDVPILAVDLYSLNEHLLVEQREGLFETSGHNNLPSTGSIRTGAGTTAGPTIGVDAAKGTTVGLTLSTVGTVRYFQPTEAAKQLGFHHFLAASSSAAAAPHSPQETIQDMNGFFTLTKRQETKVTGILILFGLPHDYTASVIAHEAFHAYMRLSPQFQSPNALISGQPSASVAAAAKPSYALPSYLQTINSSRKEGGKQYQETRCPAVVEEGLCELMAFKYLDYLSRRCTQAGIPLQTGNKGTVDLYEEQRAERFRAYCRYRIRTNENPIYGEGFRRANVIAEMVSLPVLLEYVAENRDFPPV